LAKLRPCVQPTRRLRTRPRELGLEPEIATEVATEVATGIGR